MNAKFEDGVQGEAVVVSLQGRVDASNAPLLEAYCKKRLTELARKSLVIDLRAAEYFSSAGLRSILILGKYVKVGGGRLALCGLKGLVLETFTVSGFLGLFPVADTPELAANLVAPKPGAPGGASAAPGK